MPYFKEISQQILHLLNEFSDNRRRVLFGDLSWFEVWLKEQGVEDKDPVSGFINYIQNNKNNGDIFDILKSWEDRLTITLKDLEFKVQKFTTEETVKYQPDLAEKYLGKYVTYSAGETVDHCFEKNGTINILDDMLINKKIRFIGKNQSVVFYHDSKPIGAVIRNAASQNLSEHFGIKIKNVIDTHYTLIRGSSHAASGTMVGIGFRKNPENSSIGPYAYKNKALGPEEQKIIDNDGNTLAKWLYNFGRNYLPFTALSYDEFKEKVSLEDDKIIGAVFCAKNYEAIGHTDKDRSEFAVGYVYEEGTVEEGYFFYPGYGIVIELTSNSVWCWLTKAVHGTSKLKTSDGGIRYTAAITLTERTARTIEKEKELNEYK